MTIRPVKAIVWLAAIGAAALVALSFRPQPIPVDLASVERGPLRVTIDEEGVTRAQDTYMVSAPVAGRLLRIDLEPGDAVTAGKTILATFLPGTPSLLNTRTRAEGEARMKAALAVRDQARVALQRAQDELAYSTGELKRQQQLVKTGGVTEERLAAVELDARMREAQLRGADLAVQAAEHELEAARAALQQISIQAGPRQSGDVVVIRSPIDGVVLRRHHESEALVPAGEPLIEIGDPGRLEIVSDLLSTDAVGVRPGFAVSIERWGGDKPLKGSVRLVEPSGFTKVSALGVEEQRVNVIIDLQDAIPHGQRLGDGYRVEVSIIVWKRNDVLKVPTSSLFRLGTDWAVYSVRDGRVARATVQIGQRNASEAELLSGLDPDAQVIVHPSDTISDGARVELRR